jgi:hypothetical protein
MVMQGSIMLDAAIILIMVAGAWHWLQRHPAPQARPTAPSVEDYLFKISRLTGHSEYEIFQKSAEHWPVTRERIDADFKAYLRHQVTPHYVNDFIRRHRPQVDALRLPPL